jgi:hypothetical protein
MFFFLFLHDDRRIREAQKHVDPDSDPDPQHWLQHRNTYADGSTGILTNESLVCSKAHTKLSLIGHICEIK